MKKTSCAVLWFTVLTLVSALGQQPLPPNQPLPPQPAAPTPTPPPGQTFNQRLQNIIQRTGEPAPEPKLTKFSLDFSGGTPRELVAAIQKAMGKPLNAIIPDELGGTVLPALKMSNVDVAQLFQALAAASRKSEAVVSGGRGPMGPSHQIADTSCGFRQASEGKPTDETIWYFYVQKPAFPPVTSSAKVCRFYSLAPYLSKGATVDDITTAIETGWKMLGETSPPTISFHKDTKLLIAVGEPSKLETIDAVLKALEPQTVGGNWIRPPTNPPEPPKAGR